MHRPRRYGPQLPQDEAPPIGAVDSAMQFVRYRIDKAAKDRELLEPRDNDRKWHSLPVDGLPARMSVGEGTSAVERPPGARGKVTRSYPRHHPRVAMQRCSGVPSMFDSLGV
jgi:hypothetical protein